MRIGFYSPYFDSLSGGERYALTLASYWSKSHDVSLFWDDPTIIKQAENRFRMDLKHVKTVPNIFQNNPLISKLFASSQYDLIFSVSDGSVPFSCAAENILLFQAPFQHVSFPWWKRMRYQAIVVYSEFVKQTIDVSVRKNISVIAPPVDIKSFTPQTKMNVIVSVGRFNEVKKQDMLIEAFKKGHKEKKLKGWKLVLLGGLLPNDTSYLASIKRKAKGLPVEFFPNCTFDELKKYYGIATVYWHAAGFGESDPVKMEHFGITTVEAMAAGCIPIVYDGGGQKEIVTNGDDGYLWNSVDELLIKTILATSDAKFTDSLSRNAKKKSQKFSQAVFYNACDTLLASFTK